MFILTLRIDIIILYTINNYDRTTTVIYLCKASWFLCGYGDYPRLPMVVSIFTQRNLDIPPLSNKITVFVLKFFFHVYCHRYVKTDLFHHIFSNRAKLVIQAEPAGGTSQRHTYLTLLEDGYESMEWWEHEALDLIHWGRVTYICVGNLTIIGSGNGLSPGWHQAIIGTNTSVKSKFEIFIQGHAFENVVCEMAAILSRPQFVITSCHQLSQNTNAVIYRCSDVGQ